MANQSREARNNKIIKWMWRGLALFFIALLLVFFLIYNGFIGYMPPVAQLRNPTDNFASTMLTRDKVPMGKVFQSKGNRYFAEFNFGYNGSERFARNHRWGFFPSVGVAWVISN
ncbi:MAG: hypothetical protein IJ925_07395, partial [Muribaculaceae bacterium]|nr:hypothetical protein [Muribaculaceae bacterium]